MRAWAVDDEPVQLWDATVDLVMPDELFKALLREQELWAHNAQFERMVSKHALGIELPIERTHCSMVLAMSLGLPGKLEDLGAALGLGADKAKDKDGKKLIQRFCKPAPKNHKAKRYDRHTHPEEWERFKEYCIRDVESMRHIIKLLPRWNYNAEEQALYHLDQKIIERGFNVDLDLAHAAIRATEKAQEKLADEIFIATDGKVHKATQRDKLLDHLNEVHDVGLENMQKGTIADALDNPAFSEETKLLLRIRKQASKSSTAKYNKAVKCTCEDGRLKGTIQMNGAKRTRRMAGRLFQTQNLTRSTFSNSELDIGIQAMKLDCADLMFDHVMELASSAVRGLIIPGEGNKLVVSDLSNIEGRVGAWLSNEYWKIREYTAFDRGEVPDLYNLAYSRFFGVPVERVTKSQRSVGKLIELMYMYAGGVGATVEGAKNYRVDLTSMADGILLRAPRHFIAGAKLWYEVSLEAGNTFDLTEHQFLGADVVKRMWRAQNPQIVKMWKKLESAAESAVHTPDTNFVAERLTFRRTGQWLLCFLPSKRVLCYFRPKVTSKGLEYWGTHPTTGVWGKRYAYGGLFLENADQAVAGDVMKFNMPEIEAQGYKILFTVHDEVPTETPDSPEFNARGLSAMLATVPPWAEGLPLAAAGFESYRYRKD
jgi:DNA polymerase